MSDILVTSPYRPFTLPNQFKAVFNGFIYCGTVDAVDPSNSQVQVYVVNEDGSRTPVAQPLRTNAGGFLVFSGQPAKFVTDSNHSMVVRDYLGNQLWYIKDVAIADPDIAFQTIGAQARESIRRSYKNAGFNLRPYPESFERGGYLVEPNDVLLYENDGKAYSGQPGNVLAGTNPALGGFVDRSGCILSDKIKNSDSYQFKRSLHGCGKSLGAENSLITCTMLSEFFDVVDCDISTTSDNVPVLLHNLNVNGITSGSGSIFTLTAAQIASQRVLAFDGTPFEGQPLTTWSQLLDAASRRGKFVTAELKNTQTPAIPNILYEIESKNMSKNVRLQCLNINRLLEVRAINSDINIEILVYDGMPAPSLEYAVRKAVELGNCGINVDINYSRLSDAVYLATSAGVNISSFTAVYATDEMIARREIGRMQITTDFVGV